MIIEIDIAVAHDEDAHGHLDRILYRVEDGWHILGVTGLEGFEDTSWFRDEGRAGARVRALIREATRRSAYPSKLHHRRTRVTSKPQRVHEHTPEDAAGLAEQALTVLIENRFGDGAFVERVVAEFDGALNKYWRMSTTPVVFDSVGGKGQMQREVEKRCHQGPRPRLVVVVDSDRRVPSAQPSIEARRLFEACREREIPCWVLAKREAENYLPQVLLDAHKDAGAEHRRRVDEWAKLDDDQKDFYDMKEGLPKEPSEVEEVLFAALSQRQKALLAQGFGGKIGQCWGHYPAQARHALQERGRGDLERGLDLMRQGI